ncbi:MAG TPA: GNAT family N-acetyltransferase, partial [Mesorhizobium sp.]|nr:GNAT family N-acetyltransferase [Mesorhizobium sp.]
MSTENHLIDIAQLRLRDAPEFAPLLADYVQA